MQYREPTPGEGATLDVIERRGETRTRPQMPQGLPLFKPPYSRMTANRLKHWGPRLDETNGQRRPHS